MSNDEHSYSGIAIGGSRDGQEIVHPHRYFQCYIPEPCALVFPLDEESVPELATIKVDHYMWIPGFRSSAARYWERDFWVLVGKSKPMDCMEILDLLLQTYCKTRAIARRIGPLV